MNSNQQTEMHGFILERTAKRMKQYFQQQLSNANTGITIDQWVLLQILDEQEGLSQLEIAKAAYKDAPTVTRIIDLLCKKKLAIRVADPQDRRRFKIQLTKTGHKKIEEVTPIIKNAREAAWKGLNQKETNQLVQVLDKVFENIQ